MKKIIVLLCLIIVLLSQVAQLTRTGRPTITPTPWIKQGILIEMSAGKGVDIWTDNAETDVLEIRKIEGIIDAIVMQNGHMIYARVDPRYDKFLVAEAIKKRLGRNVVETRSGLHHQGNTRLTNG